MLPIRAQNVQDGNTMLSRRFGDRMICFSLETVTLAADHTARLPRGDCN